MEPNYNYILITRTGGTGDLLMIEPSIEALYYQYAPARIILRTYPGYEWVLEDSPFIWKTIFDDYACQIYGMIDSGIFISDLNGILDSTVKLKHINFSNIIEGKNHLHGVDAFASHADVKLLRNTPSFGRYDFNFNHKIVIQLRDDKDGRGLTRDMLPMNLLSDAIFIDSTDVLPNNEYKDVISSCDMFIGSDSSGLHIAHAAGVRKIIGFYISKYPYTARAYPGIRCATTILELDTQIKYALLEEKYPEYLNNGNGADFIKNKALQCCHGKGLDVGSNQWPLHGALALPTENDRHLFNQGPFDFIFSSHCLEHIDNWQDELKLWEQSIKIGGTCFMYLPHPTMEKWIPGSEWVGPWHRWSPSPVTLVKWLHENTNLKVEEYSCYPDSYWSFYIVARRIS